MSTSYLGLVLAFLLAGIFVLPLYWVLLSRFPMVVLPGGWEIGGVRFSAQNLVVGFTLLGLGLRYRLGSAIISGKIPYLISWLVLGVMGSLSYLHAPDTQQYSGEWARLAYQVGRYNWSLILFYPLSALLLTDARKVGAAALVLVVSADLISVRAVTEGYSGEEAASYFSTGNALGAALLLPFLVSCASALDEDKRFLERGFFLASSLLMGRALLFTGSRGAIAAAVIGILLLTSTLMTRPDLRSRLWRYVPAAILATSLLLVLKPDILERPTIRRAMTATEGTQSSTMRWRTEQRWPHFIEIIKENPWYGVGDIVDKRLGTDANTPHNGYLALAVRSGLPVLLFYLLFAFRAVRDGILAGLRRSTPAPNALLTFGFVCGMIAFLIHNIIDSNLHRGFAADAFWMATAVLATTRLWSDQAESKGGASLEPRVQESPKQFSIPCI